MIRRKFPFLGAILAGIAMAGLAVPARADFQIQFAYGGAVILYDANTSTTTTSGGASVAGATITYSAQKEQITISNLVVSNTGTSGGFAVDAVISKSNKPGTVNVAQITMSGLNFTNQTGVGGNSKLTITTGDTGFTAPVLTQGTLKSTISATADGLNSHNASVVFNSYIDTTNKQFGTQQGGPQINLNVAPGSSGSGNTFATVDASNIPYSLTQVAQITLANGDAFTDGSSGTSLMAPAPASMLLALSGLPILGLTWIRRRGKPAVTCACSLAQA